MIRYGAMWMYLTHSLLSFQVLLFFISVSILIPPSNFMTNDLSSVVDGLEQHLIILPTTQTFLFRIFSFYFIFKVSCCSYTKKNKEKKIESTEHS